MSDAGWRLIQEFEGFVAEAYPDPLHGWELPTIGFGTTQYADGRPVRRGDRISREQAALELRHVLDSVITPRLRRIPYFEELSEPMVGALQSFAYNLGADFFGSEGFETISQKLRAKEWTRMREVFLLYRNPGTGVEAGLRRRRSAEASLWEAGLEVGFEE